MNKKLNILHIIDSLRIGGAEVLMTQIIKALGNDDYKHFVYFFDSDGDLRHLINNNYVNIHKGKERKSIINPIKFIISIYNMINDLIFYINKNKIHIIQSHLPQANQLAVIVGKIAKIPTFPTVHTPMDNSSNEKTLNLKILIKNLLNIFIYKKADKIIVVSKEIKEKYLIKYRLADNKIFILNNGIIAENIQNYQDIKNNRNLLNENRIKILAVGRLVPLKNFDKLILAGKELLAMNYNDWEINIAGEGSERPVLQRMINKLGLAHHVKLLGLKNNVLDLMRSSKIFVMPSSYEGLSIAMIEAMASGLPIVASNIRGLSEYVLEDKNGLLFTLNNEKEMAVAIAKLLQNKELRDMLSQGARNSFDENYDLRKNIIPLEVLFRSFTQ